MIDLRGQLIECGKQKGQSRWKCSLTSLGIHGLILGFVIFMGATATHKVDGEQKPIRAFLAAGAAPPPPPPPPPPAGSSAPKATPKPVIQPVPQTSFVQPRQIPQELPKVQPTSMASAVETAPAEPATPAGVPGGVPGGVAGGVVGGTEGGVVGGQIGGTPGGVVGGTVGGTGDAPATPEPAPPPPPPPPPPPEPHDDGPLRVGGDVKAPQVIKRVEPKYTDTARKARVTGVVIVEAIIDKNGNVDSAKVLKGLDLGLTEQAVEAVKQWKFRPGTLNGEPVDVIFNLTVNFTLQ
jgi:protein TonB